MYVVQAHVKLGISVHVSNFNTNTNNSLRHRETPDKHQQNTQLRDKTSIKTIKIPNYIHTRTDRVEKSDYSLSVRIT